MPGPTFQNSFAAASRLAAGALFLLLSASAFAAPASQSVDFRPDWRFSKGDPAGAEAADFNDAQWTAARLPHDWAIAGPFHAEENGYAAKLPWRGVGWYRKHFKLDRVKGDRVYLDFDGVMAFPKVYVNGQLAGNWDYGYTSFRIDATPLVNLQGDNVVAVRVDATRHGTRWYPGAGIYRKVTLQLRRPVHLAHWATRLTTPQVSDASATVNLQTVVENHADKPANVVIEVQLRHPNPVLSSLAGSATAKVSIPAKGSQDVAVAMNVVNPKRWDIDDPQLYTAVVLVHPESADGRPDHSNIDEDWIPFGIRDFTFTADDGFYLNGRRVQLYGVNLHHDHGPLGAAFYTRAMERQLQIMKDMGANAIRTSHNAPAPELVDLCDRMGLVVWDECFDKWNETADRVDGQPSLRDHAQRHLQSMVKRDRNHPSVVVWSIGNEIKGGGRDGLTPERVAMMRDVVRQYDDTRPVGIGCHIPDLVAAGVFDQLDLTGWNYRRQYMPFHERYPDKPVVYSESASALSIRGFYSQPLPTDKTDYARRQRQVSSYDLNAAPWSDIADREFRLMENDRFVAGEFVWTGFDYLGEPTPFEQDAKSSYFGIVDLCGIPKDRFYLYRSHWRPDVPTVHIVPHWNWPDRVGQNVPVFVYTNGDEAELLLNGQSLGRRAKRQAPTMPPNFAVGAQASASSTQPGHGAADAADGEGYSRWCAASDDDQQWLQFDLGESRPLKCFLIEFERDANNYGYEIKTSDDGDEWSVAVEHPAVDTPPWTAARNISHKADARGRYIRIEFNDLRNDAWASIRDFRAYPELAESNYYASTYDYRLRWNDVAYQPGELKAVAYKNGKEIGAATVRTAGPPAAIRLTPDRTKLHATGDDLCYVLVEAIDNDGILCPLADNLIRFAISGPADVVGVGNGNPLALEPFQAHRRKLFFGKAMLIVRPTSGQGGEVRIAASSDGLAGASTTCFSQPEEAVPPARK